MTLILYCEQSFSIEKQWIIGILLKRYLGVEYRIKQGSNDTFSLEGKGKKLIISDSFFSNLDDTWLKLESLPKQPLESFRSSSVEGFDPSHSEIPIIYGSNLFSVQDKSINLGIDIFGSAFFMLSRYEEAFKTDRDQHSRFPSNASLAYQENFLSRPIINEYLELLKFCINSLWPELELKKRTYHIKISCDVDQPYQCGIKNIKLQTKHILGDIFKRRSLSLLTKSIINFFLSKRGIYSHDIYYQNLLWMMKVNKQIGNKVTFNFIACHSDNKMDGCYSLEEDIISKLLHATKENGHYIGLHTSFHTYQDLEQTKLEADLLRSKLLKINIKQPLKEVRQHYLRWDSSCTPYNLDKSKLEIETTLGYADHAGFRSGICYEYPLYDLINRKPLTIIEYPLIVMDCSIIGKSYMGLGYTQSALQLMLDYKDTCKQYNGNFVFLWHNSFFTNKFSYYMYKQLIN